MKQISKYLFTAFVVAALAATTGGIVLTVIFVSQISNFTISRSIASRLVTLRQAAGLPEEGEYYYTSDILTSDVFTASAFDISMREINPDYVCWIMIYGTNVDYPVVRASDNERYLNTSFLGERNRYGTLFMDYRNTGEFVPHIIIYGHNTQDGSKFGTLHNFLDDEFLANHPVITLKVNDRIVEYEIFSARLTDINDPAYFLDFSAPGSFRAFLERNGAPPDAVQILTLSTCVGRVIDDNRLVVQGALRLNGS